MRSRVWPYALVAAATLLTLYLSASVILQQKRSDAQVEIEAIHSELELALATLSVRMSGMAHSIERMPELSPASYMALYAEATRSSTRVHERAMAFMPEMASPDRIRAIVAELDGEFDAVGYPEFQLFPSQRSGTLFPAVMVEPYDSRANVFGYDMGSSEVRVSAALEALAQGVMKASAPIALTQDVDPAEASFLLFYPVYFPGEEVISGASRAVLGAGVTPAALLADHVSLYDRHVVQVEIAIGGVTLPVTVGQEPRSSNLLIPLMGGVTMDDIRTSGFDVPFVATVYYAPSVLDLLLPFVMASLVALLGLLLVYRVRAREAAKVALERALRAKETELGEIYRVKAQSQRIEALGRLVGGVAHDFNNILSVILGNLELLKERDVPAEDEVLVDDAVTATQRGAHLTRQLLSVGRKSYLQPAAFDAAGALEETATMLSRVLPESIRLKAVSATGLWTVQADSDGLQNALLNLAINARDAMDGRGTLTLEATNTQITPGDLSDPSDDGLPPGRYVTISVTDTGTGMAPEVLDRAFEPFFTTKRAGEGSGLGLASVLGFCRQSNGTCRITSELGMGTTVHILLPVSEDAVVDRAPSPDARGKTWGMGRILLAEDEDTVAKVMSAQLTAAGYGVTRVGSADAALQRLDAGERFDLLITDSVMPGRIQGVELTRQVEAKWPDMAQLLISGYPHEGGQGDGVTRRHAALSKPVEKQALLRLVGQLLEARKAPMVVVEDRP